MLARRNPVRIAGYRISRDYVAVTLRSSRDICVNEFLQCDFAVHSETEIYRGSTVCRDGVGEGVNAFTCSNINQDHNRIHPLDPKVRSSRLQPKPQ